MLAEPRVDDGSFECRTTFARTMRVQQANHLYCLRAVTQPAGVVADDRHVLNRCGWRHRVNSTLPVTLHALAQCLK